MTAHGLRLAAQVARVANLHVKNHAPNAKGELSPFCAHCSHLAREYVNWPCPTAAALGCPCGCPDDMHIGEIGCPCALPGESPCAPPEDGVLNERPAFYIDDVGRVGSDLVRMMSTRVDNAGLFGAGDLLRQVARLIDGEATS